MAGFSVHEKYYLSNQVWSRGTESADRGAKHFASLISAPIPATPYSRTLGAINSWKECTTY